MNLFRSSALNSVPFLTQPLTLRWEFQAQWDEKVSSALLCHLGLWSQLITALLEDIAAPATVWGHDQKPDQIWSLQLPVGSGNELLWGFCMCVYFNVCTVYDKGKQHSVCLYCRGLPILCVWSCVCVWLLTCTWLTFRCLLSGRRWTGWWDRVV